MPRAAGALRRLAQVVAVLYILGCVLLYVVQDKLIFVCRSPAIQPAAPATIVAVPQGTLMLWMPPPTPGGPVVVHFHGTGGQIAHEQWLGAALAGRGAGFAAVEYPGFGLADGEASERTSMAAARAALRQLTGSMGISADRIVLSGHSLGTGIAVALAAEGWGARVLLVSPYTSLMDIASGILPFLPVRWMMTSRFDSLALASKVDQPVLILHGTEDTRIPIRQGEALAAALPSARILRLEGVGHEDVWQHPQAKTSALVFLAP